MEFCLSSSGLEIRKELPWELAEDRKCRTFYSNPLKFRDVEPTRKKCFFVYHRLCHSNENF